ncbi:MULTISPECIES: helix-turn-helix domain-containing protein [Tatumella]|uniref:Helix-turn-helix domain-containing protein n=1 Tax=Tatumella punctata TaxID=399969 RepID=A0ABW1VNX2_9GAMM|nr:MULTISPECIES: helix-turn-helix domain-containing protein [unclassified Tatumella]MBS0854901.1 helix-turn-helix domain-containing protein [Tatumella sp. JGM16]MBS0876412.1 helix-turn-helix domain-containing protein [Tatumella sp. JGM82]MBS0889585.1 helix-turn-helix domain-containing protein [Tatumella sp. JGM94]MBS0893057.1 helix-turn-helix domain-containing protein [Tatumella sp. JGM130]MBS0900707.1 helix-turn-helix domain-containing protein [Tatumella sp. JGM100]
MLAKPPPDYGLQAYFISYCKNYGYNGITFIYVISGSVRVISDNRQVVLDENDIMTINQSQDYSIISDQDNVVLLLEISGHFISRYYRKYYSENYVVLPGEDGRYREGYIDNLRDLIFRLFICPLKGNDEIFLLESNSILSKIMMVLIAYFRVRKEGGVKKTSGRSRRVEEIVKYINNNYTSPVSLQRIAEKQGMSLSYLSRLFKQEVGVSYRDYLHNRRFESAIIDLLNSNKPNYQIARDHGFSDSRQFVSLFRKNYQKTPSQFRRDNAYQIDSSRSSPQIRESIGVVNKFCQPVSSARVLSLLSHMLNQTQGEGHHEAFSGIEESSVDISRQPAILTPAKRAIIITVGEFSELLKTQVQQQISLLSQAGIIDFVDLSPGISVTATGPGFHTDEPVNTYSAYADHDAAISFLYRLNIPLFIRLRQPATEPLSELFIHQMMGFLQHCLRLYGRTYVSRWHFVAVPAEDETLQAEGNPFFCDLFSAIKSLCHGVKTGGMCFFRDGRLTEYSYLRAMPLSTFIEFIGCDIENDNGQNSGAGNRSLQQHTTDIGELVRQLTRLLQEELLFAPLILMRWNTLTGDTRHINGSFFRAAIIFNFLQQLPASVCGVSLALNTEILKETLPSRIDTRGIAVFYTGCLKRPVFYVLGFIRRMHGIILAQDGDYILTKTATGYQMVVTNAAIFDPRLSVQESVIRNLRKKKKIVINGIEAGQYQLTRAIFDQQHGDLYSLFQLFQTEYGRVQEVIDYLNRHTGPGLRVRDEYLPRDQWILLAEMEANAIHFYELTFIGQGGRLGKDDGVTAIN